MLSVMPPCIDYLFYCDKSREEVSVHSGAIMALGEVPEEYIEDMVDELDFSTFAAGNEHLVSQGYHDALEDGYDCRGYVAGNGISFSSPGCDMCRCCELGGKNSNDILLEEEKAVLSRLIRNTEEGKEFFRRNECPFGSFDYYKYIYISMKIKHPLCVPISSIIYGIFHDDILLFERISELVIKKSGSSKMNDFALTVCEKIREYVGWVKGTEAITEKQLVDIFERFLFESYFGAVPATDELFSKYTVHMDYDSGAINEEELPFGDAMVTVPEIDEGSDDEIDDETKESLREELNQLRKASRLDSASGLLNRNAYEADLNDYNDGEYLAVVYFDVNNLKYINDNYGHANGDVLISTIAKAISERFPFIYRVGGDEFVAFVRDESVDCKAEIEHIELFLNDMTDESEEGMIYSASCGFCMTEKCDDVRKLVADADRLMQENKAIYKANHPAFNVREAQEEVIVEQLETGNEWEDEVPIFEPPGELAEHPFLTKKVDIIDGGFLGKNDKVRRVPQKNRVYVVPFEKSSFGGDIEKNVIIHHEMSSGELSDKDCFDCSNYDNAKTQLLLNYLSDKVRKDKRMAAEVVYITDIEKYVLLIWSEASNKFLSVDLIYRKDGRVLPIPYQILYALKDSGIKIICYQPYMLCGIMSLYQRDIEIKNVHSIYSTYCVLMKNEKGVSHFYHDIMESYLFAPSEELKKRISVADKRFSEKNELLKYMSLYGFIFRLQYDYSEFSGNGGLCASRHKKDLMYGYSYLASGIFPSLQGASFRLQKNGQYVFYRQPEPAISYSEGYFVKYTFKNVDSNAPDEEGIKKEVDSNKRARSLLLKRLATIKEAYYHNHLKILYFDDYNMIFYMSHNYMQANQQFIETALKQECTREKITTNQFKYSCWATTFDMVRFVNKH